MANSGDLLGNLQHNEMTKLLTHIFSDCDVTIALCNEKIHVRPLDNQDRIIAEYHSSIIGGHKGVTETYRRIREHYTWTGMSDEICEYIRGSKSRLEKKLGWAKKH